jgi:hypothetical protein
MTSNINALALTPILLLLCSGIRAEDILHLIKECNETIYHLSLKCANTSSKYKTVASVNPNYWIACYDTAMKCFVWKHKETGMILKYDPNIARVYDETVASQEERAIPTKVPSYNLLNCGTTPESYVYCFFL